MTYITCKEMQTNDSLFEKTLSLKKGNIYIIMRKQGILANAMW